MANLQYSYIHLDLVSFHRTDLSRYDDFLASAASSVDDWFDAVVVYFVVRDYAVMVIAFERVASLAPLVGLLQAAVVVEVVGLDSVATTVETVAATFSHLLDQTDLCCNSFVPASVDNADLMKYWH